MRTRTGELLMRKLQLRPASPVQDPPPEPTNKDSAPQEPIKLLKRHPTHISHINEYNFVSVVNKREESVPSREDFKNLQIQNLRLIEENMRLTEWTHNLLNKLRQNIMQSVQAIQQFKYLQGVNLLYHFLEKLNVEDENDFKLLKRTQLLQENQLLRRHMNHESKNTISLHFNRLQICQLAHSYTYIPSKGKGKGGKEENPFFMANQRPDFSDLIPKQPDQPWHRIIISQGLALESFMKKGTLP